MQMQIHVPVPAFDEFDSSNTPASLSSARRVAPSVSGGSRRMSLSAPVRVLQSKLKDDEGDGGSTNIRKRYVIAHIQFFIAYFLSYALCDSLLSYMYM